MNLQVYEAIIDPSPLSDLEVSFMGMVDRPAIEIKFDVFKEQQAKLNFAINDELHIIQGPCMVADLEMYRNDGTLGEYYVKFSAPTIQTIVEKFSAKGYLQKFNIMHDPNQTVEGVTIFNSFITSDKLGISAPKGFEDLSMGSWFISVKIDNPQVWARVKSGEIKGFSVEGIFEYVPAKFIETPEQSAMRKFYELIGDDMKAQLIKALNETD